MDQYAMKKHYKLDIPQPCTEKWESFEKAPEGGFCQRCQVNVVDFTHMSDREIISYFENHTGESCGRFLPNQLGNLTIEETPKRWYSSLWLKAAAASTALFASLNSSFAQTEPLPINSKSAQHAVIDPTTRQAQLPMSVRGTVKDANGEPLIGANILVMRSMQEEKPRGTVAGLDGDFTLGGVYPGDTLRISFVGFAEVHYVIQHQTELELTLDDDIILGGAGLVMMGSVTTNQVYHPKESRMGKLWRRLKAKF
jgi:hypothetical protein